MMFSEISSMSDVVFICMIFQYSQEPWRATSMFVPFYNNFWKTKSMLRDESSMSMLFNPMAIL